MSIKEQRMYVKFCFKVEKTAAEPHNMLHEAYGNHACFASPAKKYDRCAHE
jgi:hypothetical protein